MSSPEAQAIVNAACDQVQSVILDQMIQGEEKKLSQDQDSYQTMRKQREGDRQQLKAPKNPRNLLWLNSSKSSQTCSQNIPNFVVN